MFENGEVAFAADRIIEVLCGGTMTIEAFAAKTPWSIDELRKKMYPSTKEERMGLIALAKHYNVSPRWLMGYDVPKQQSEEEKKLYMMTDIVGELANKPALLEIVLRMSGISKEEAQSILNDSSISE